MIQELKNRLTQNIQDRINKRNDSAEIQRAVSREKSWEENLYRKVSELETTVGLDGLPPELRADLLVGEQSEIQSFDDRTRPFLRSILPINLSDPNLTKELEDKIAVQLLYIAVNKYVDPNASVMIKLFAQRRMEKFKSVLHELSESKTEQSTS